MTFSQKWVNQNLKHLTGDWQSSWLTFRKHDIVKVKPYVSRPTLHLSRAHNIRGAPPNSGLPSLNSLAESLVPCFVTLYSWIWVSKTNTWTVLLHPIKQVLTETKYNTSSLQSIQNKKHYKGTKRNYVMCI